jgi:hypothetical protein
MVIKMQYKPKSKKSKIKPIINKIINNAISAYKEFYEEELNVELTKEEVIKLLNAELDDELELNPIIFDEQETKEFEAICKRNYDIYLDSGTLTKEGKWTTKNRLVPLYIATKLHQEGLELPISTSVTKYDDNLIIKIYRSDSYI